MRNRALVMECRRSKRLLLPACFSLLCLAIPFPARADAISLPLVFARGVIVLTPLTAFVVFVEGVFLSIGLRIPYRRTLPPLLLANLLSLAVGIPVKFFNAELYAAILPRELAPYFRDYPKAILLGTAIYFIYTLLTEYVVIILWRVRKSMPARACRTALVVLAANLATYAVLAPLHYLATRPMHDIREFTDTSQWASRPVAQLYYVEKPSGYLCLISTDGQGRQVILPRKVRDYQLLADAAVVLYRNEQNDLCLSRSMEENPIVCWKTDERYTMEEVACSPDAKYVAYLKCVGDLRPYNLVLYDVEARRTVETDITTHEDDYSPEIAWSIDPSVLFLEHQRQVEAIRIQADRSVTRAATDAGEIILAPAFGRFAESESWDWGGYYSSDRPSDTEAYAVPGLGNHLRITRNGSTFILADNPGLMRFSNRGFSEVCILENDKELVFDDAQDLYLLDMDDRRVGKIADGSNFMLLLDRYRRRIRTE